MRGDENRNIDVPSKVKAFRKDFPPDKVAIHTSYKVLEIGGAPAVEGRALVVLLGHENEPYNLLAEAYATRGLRAPVPGAQGMKDTRDAERAMTGAVGRALFLMGYGEKADDSSDYAEPAEADPDAWYKTNGWSSQDHHDSFMEDAKLAVKELTEPYRQQAIDAWHKQGLKWPLPKPEFEKWVDFLLPLGRKSAAETAAHQESVQSVKGNSPVVKLKAGTGAGDEVGDEPAPAQPPLGDAVGPDAPLVKR